MNINVQTLNGLQEIGKVTKDKVVSALGYIPAAETDVLDNISEDERGELILEDLSGKVTFADEQGNIVANVDADGIKTTTVTANKFLVNNADVESEINKIDPHIEDTTSHITAEEREAWNSKVIPSDLTAAVNSLEEKITEGAPEDLNTLAKISSSINNDPEFAKTTEAALDTKADKTTVNEHTQDTVVHVTTEQKQYWDNKSEFSGIYAELQDAPNIVEDDSGEVIVADEAGIIVARIGAEGLSTTKVVANEITLGGQDLQETLNTHHNDEVIHITAEERTNWNEKVDEGELSGAIKSLKDELIEGAPTNLATFNKVSAALNNDPAFAQTVENTKADKSTVEAHVTDDVKHITAAERETWNNKSDFSGIYSELRDAPNITEDNSGNVIVADESGNIIAKIDGKGLETTQVCAEKVVVNDMDIEESITTHDGNNVKHITSSERTTWNSKVSTATLEGAIKGLEDKLVDTAPDNLNTIGKLSSAIGNDANYAQTVENKKADKTVLQAHTSDADCHVTTDDKAYWNNKSDFSGIYSELRDAPNILEDDSGEVVVADESGNVVAKIGAGGIETTDVVAKKVVINGTDITTTIQNHTSDDVVHITNDERLSWNERTTHSEVETNIKSSEDKIIDGAPTDLNTIKKLSTAVGNDPNFATTIDNKKADKIELITHTSDSDIHITEQERQIWNNKSDFSGIYSELRDAPNILEDDSGGVHVADEGGNIILSIDVNGLNTTAVNARTIIVNGIDIESKFNELVPITNDEIDAICNGTLTSFLEGIAAEEE